MSRPATSTSCTSRARASGTPASRTARLVPVRHCYDFNIVGTTMADDLSDTQRAEMVEFFQRELQTPTWMRALSPYDADAAFSLRPDHQWNGAYPAWPADAGRGAVRARPR